jgi:prophage regulatory protein
MTRYLRKNECERMTGLSRSTLWRLEREGSFPRRRKLSANAVGWLENEVRIWLQKRAQLRR